MQVNFNFQAFSHKGKLRDHNDDSYYAHSSGVFGVFDGIGSLRGGDVAAQCSAGVLKAMTSQLATDYQAKIVMQKFFQNADEAVQKIGASSINLFGLACTGLCAIIRQDENRLNLYIGNLGDTRIYLFREGGLYQLGIDQSWYQISVREGENPTDVEERKYKNAITNAIGLDGSAHVDFYQSELLEGDLVFMCTDGVHGYIDHQEMTRNFREALSQKNLSTEEMLKDIVRLTEKSVMEGQAGDNFTMLAVAIGNISKQVFKEQTRWISGDHVRGQLLGPSEAGLLDLSWVNGQTFMTNNLGHAFYLKDLNKMQSALEQAGCLGFLKLLNSQIGRIKGKSTFV